MHLSFLRRGCCETPPDPNNASAVVAVPATAASHRWFLLPVRADPGEDDDSRLRVVRRPAATGKSRCGPVAKSARACRRTESACPFLDAVVVGHDLLDDVAVP
eukprot:CAMPEP_0201128974 /NCGR_PEP_ID=MMETSP0850-20130426/35361_1 /ASSEMBLY_ACC=CAM_ASM_000622 /TAXON_ID=183588 /ORGANISM="Pseudo-nitzschia fraudulenta, Strain WWA7" /LENGTH=102 /DNA_ID=CAMNT_0047398317 /DNA_START=203 /DNA_END=508 /DNA_ORIENTATION=-